MYCVFIIPDYFCELCNCEKRPTLFTALHPVLSIRVELYLLSCICVYGMYKVILKLLKKCSPDGMCDLLLWEKNSNSVIADFAQEYSYRQIMTVHDDQHTILQIVGILRSGLWWATHIKWGDKKCVKLFLNAYTVFGRGTLEGFGR